MVGERLEAIEQKTPMRLPHSMPPKSIMSEQTTCSAMFIGLAMMSPKPTDVIVIVDQ